MELDDLKKSWRASSEKQNLSNTNIMQLIQHKSYGPIAQLKRRFKKGMIVIPLVLSLLTLQLSKTHDIFSDVLFWSYVALCLFIMAYFFFNYRLVSRMQHLNGNLKNNLEKQVALLEKGVKWRLIITRIVAVAFVVLFEILLYKGQEPSLENWHRQPLALRFGVYAGFLLFFYLLTKFAFERKYQQHVRYLKELLTQMQ